jgi:hypothetical protein
MELKMPNRDDDISADQFQELAMLAQRLALQELNRDARFRSSLQTRLVRLKLTG